MLGQPHEFVALLLRGGASGIRGCCANILFGIRNLSFYTSTRCSREESPGVSSINEIFYRQT